MSRRPSAPTLLITLALVALGLGGPLLAAPARAYGEHAFQSNTVIGSGDPYYTVYGETTLAQSFTVTQSYFLANVTLRVRNDGGPMNALFVSIHPDDPSQHRPVMGTQLANSSWVTPNNQTGPEEWDFPFYPVPLLQAGSIYWIVAENDAARGPPNDGYEWHESNSNSYAGGSAFVLNTTSAIWTGLPYDLYFLTFGREQAANLSVSLVADRSQAQPSDPVTFTVSFNNTGTESAAFAWINATLPPSLVNLSLSFPGKQPVSVATFPNLTFQGVASGPHAFGVSALVDIGVAPGTVVTVQASLDFANATGVVTRGSRASATVTVGLATKQLYLANVSATTKLLTPGAPSNPGSVTAILSAGAAQPFVFALDPPLAKSFDARSVAASLWVSTQQNPPQTYTVNLSLLDNGVPVATILPTFTLNASGSHLLNFAFPGVRYTFSAEHRIGLSLWNLGASNDALLLRYNGTAYPSHMEFTTSTYVAVDELDLENPVSNASVWSPQDPIVVFANVSDPFGVGGIGGAWINVTSPGGELAATGPMNILSTDASSLPTWILFNYTVAPPLNTGPYRVDVTATEDNGVIDRARGLAEVAAPRFAFEDATSLGRVQAGASFAYFLYYNNSGNGAAGWVWINETLPAEVAYAGSSIPYTSSSGNRLTWALWNVSVGSHELEVDVTVSASSTVPAWVRDNASLEFTDASGHFGENLAASAVVFLNGPILTVSLTSTPATGIHEKEPVVYTVSLRNTGADSGIAWMNDTLPQGFLYLSDTAGFLGAVLTQIGSRLFYEFQNIPAGSDWTFQISAQAATNLITNSTYTDSLVTNYTSTNGYLMPPENADHPLVALDPRFADGWVTFLVGTSSPGGRAPLIVRIDNTGNEAASWAWLNLTLDTRLSVLDASRPVVAGSGFARFELRDVGIGWTSVFLNVTVSPSATDGTNLGAGGALEALDQWGNPVPWFVLNPASLAVTAPSFRLTADPTDRTIEAGMVFAVTITTTNVGSTDAANLWLNATIPSPLEYVNDTAPVTPTAAGLAYSWHWRPPGDALLAGNVTTFTMNLRARGATPNGTSADIALRLEDQGMDLVRRSGINATVHAQIIAPTLVLSVEASQARIASGGTFNYTIRVSNLGLTVAHRVWIRDVLDPNVKLISYSSGREATGNGTLNWTYVDLAPGVVETIDLTVRAADGLAPDAFITNSVEATYTNSVGVTLGSLRSPPVTLRIAQDFTPILWLLAVAAALVGAFLIVRTRRLRVEIEEAFLVYRDGVLISHLSRTLMREKDEDVLSGMLTAVQEFVREAFQYGQERDLQQLDFGEYRILIERGTYVYLAVVYSGRESVALRKKVHGVIDLVEKQYGKVLAKWDGDMEEVLGASDLIRDSLLGTGTHAHNGSAPPEYE